MSFTPHTRDDINEMLNALDIRDISALFEEIPAELLNPNISSLPEPLSEMALVQHMQTMAAKNAPLVCFAGAGAYEHYIPAAVWDITARGEFMTAYTPYQAEASQGTLQLIYEYQSMMTALMQLPVSNASLYDGASACAEAVLMAARIQKSSTILVPSTLHPHVIAVMKNIAAHQGIQFKSVPHDPKTGVISVDALETLSSDAAAVVIPFPNFFGRLEDIDALTQAAHAKGLLVIAYVNPLAMTLLKPPGAWGEKGADIACGEGQPLGIPLSLGGPYFGFMTCKMEFVRQMPGRIVGRTQDSEGKIGYTLTLQAREQHIRRAKATSNICTNQGLMVTAATIAMSLLGAEGLRQMAIQSHERLLTLLSLLKPLGIQPLFAGPHFHEAALKLPVDAQCFQAGMIAEGFLPGVCLQNYYSDFDNILLVCTTEMRTPDECERYAQAAQRVLQTVTQGS